MNERSDRLMKALGDIGADLIAKAAPVFPDAPDTSEHGNIIAVTPYEPEIQLTKRDIRIYWITRILGAAAAIAIIGTGVFLLWKNWDKIAVSGNDRPGVVTTVTSDTVTPDITETDTTDPFEQITDTSMPECGIAYVGDRARGDLSGQDRRDPGQYRAADVKNS